MSQLLDADVQLLKQFFVHASWEGDFMSVVRAEMALRRCSAPDGGRGDNFRLVMTEDDKLVNLLVASMRFRNIEELVKTFARVTGADPEEICIMLEILSRNLAMFRGMSSNKAAAGEDAKGHSDSSERGWTGNSPGPLQTPPEDFSGDEQSPNPVFGLLPSDSGLVPNSEVDAKHEETRRWCEREGNIIPVVSFMAVKSPVGPAASGASLDDLTSMTLQQLHDIGGLLPSAYLRLTVVLPAVMAACPTTVVADDTGQHIRMAVYNSGAASSNDAKALLPLGARFALKLPFLKRCGDLWLGLRVDAPATLIRLDLLPLSPGQRLLVLGDGDFTFSASISSSSSRKGEAATLTATSLDSRKEVLSKYAHAEEALGRLAIDPCATVLHGVDATALPRQPGFRFDTVVWNFPYPVGKQTVIPSGVLREDLLVPFFATVGNVLESEGSVWLTLAKAQGGSTREVAGHQRRVDVESVASEHGFELLEVRSMAPGGRNLPKILMKSYEGGRVVLGARCSLRPSSFSLLNSRISVTYYDAATWGKELAEELDEEL